jgi:IclR family transcriptional regulator, acetate operon repressor
VASSPLVERVLDCLELLSGQPRGMPLSEVCRALNMPKGAAHRLLSALVQRQFAEQDETNEWYRLTLKTATIGLRFLSETGTTEICQPVLDRLARQTGELVRLAVADGDSLTWVAKAQGALSGLRYDPDMGHAVVLHATAAGRAWLATMDNAEATRIVLARGFAIPPRFNRRLIDNEAALRRELKATRERGYGLAIEEGEAGTIAIACAIHDPKRSGRGVGVVTVAGPTPRLTQIKITEIIDDVRAAAVELSMSWPMRRLVAPVSPLGAVAAPRLKNGAQDIMKRPQNRNPGRL